MMFAARMRFRPFNLKRALIDGIIVLISAGLFTERALPGPPPVSPATASQAVTAGPPPVDVELPARTQKFINDFCIDCHDVTSARAGFRIDLLTGDFSAADHADLWNKVRQKIATGQMPPTGEDRPDAKESFAVVAWIREKLHETESAAQQAGGAVPMRRMNRVEYANTVRDLFSLDDGFARRIEKELPADGAVGGFDRGAAGLFVDEDQLAQYMAVADLVLDKGVFTDKPAFQKFTYDAKRELVNGSRVAYRDTSGKVIIQNATLEFIAGLKEPLAMVPIDGFQDPNSTLKRYVPLGPSYWTSKNGGIEYVSGANNWRFPGNLRAPFFAQDWGNKGVTRDGWYRFRIQAGAFKGEGKEAQKNVQLVVEYSYGSPIEVVQRRTIDAPLNAPKEYEFLMYLQFGPPGINRSWSIGWDNGNKDVAIVNPKYWDVQWKPIDLAGQIERAIAGKRPAAEIAALQKESDDATAAALANRKTFAGPYFVYDPAIDIAKRPRLWLGQMQWEGPIVDWPPKGRQDLFFAGENREDDGYLREIFAKFLPRAYRRTATADELDRVVKWTLDIKQEQGLSFKVAVREGIKNVLCSPAFLYLGGEGAPAALAEKPSPGPQPLDSWQLASRLSYLLWSSAPDEELYRLATQDKLRDPDVLLVQAKRMMADSKSWEFVRSFAGQWLSVRNFDNGNPPNREFYRDYDDALRDSSKREPLEFFAEVLKDDLPVTSFLDSDFLVINECLAKHYGIGGVEGDQFRRVPAPPDDRRGGVLGMAGILTYLADGTRTLPVRRANWVLDTLWNQPTPPPPPNVGELPTIKDKNLTVRERLSQHRSSQNCASCHARMDSFGLALENYDAVGMWRDRQNGEGMRGDADSPPLDVSGQLPDGTPFETVQQYKSALIAHKEIFITAFTDKLLCYALGRPITYGDHLAVEQIDADAATHGYRLQELISAIVRSNDFRTQ